MSNFSELLKQPLPSARLNDDTTVVESTDDVVKEETDVETEGVEAEAEVAEGDDPSDVGTDDIEDIATDDSEDLGDFDVDDLSDEELMALDGELSRDAIDTVADDGEEEVKLSPEEEIEADDMMATAATAMLVKDELNATEKAAFVSNESEIKTAINEGFITESDVNVLSADANIIKESAEDGEVFTEKNYNKKMIIRLDAAAKQKQLYALAVNVSAAAHNDPDYKKLKKVMKLRKILRAKLDRKYHSEASKRARVYFMRLKKSNSPTLAKIGKENGPKD